MNELNCKLYKNQFEKASEPVTAKYNSAMFNSYRQYFELINAKQSNLVEFCDYLNWAYVSYVDLNDAETLESVRNNVCAPYFMELN